MIFDKYIALIIESIERHSALTLTELREQNKILQAEIGALSKKFTDSVEADATEKKQLYEKIVKLEEEILAQEREKQSLEDVAEDAHREYDAMKNAWDVLSEENINLRSTNDSLLEESQAYITEMNELRDKIVQLEQEVKDIEKVHENATQAHTEAMGRLLDAVKVYDKATVSMLNAILERRGSVEERAEWEKAKEALRNWDKPKKKPGRPKKQS